ncbi:uncharacterized protein LOC126810219 [Patella vulgata]|uniref:uncharacterized protein LOC126810219 n=1 Tax=Patella vulgata TaxID=6465 RepID=UPI00217FEC46|nr:uncharacterized protein LOC126810219 [Patella vulgata]
MAGKSGKCDEEMLLLEQKYSSGPTSKFKVSDELCGKRSDYIRRFGDSSIRLTYLLGGSDGLKLKGGFFAQVTAESISRGSSLINVKCKSVHTDGTSAPNISQFPSRPTNQRTNRVPVIIKEQKQFIPPLRVDSPVTASPAILTTMANKPLQATSPRWRIGPRGRKYIPRPGHANGPLFLDGGGARVIRRRYPGGRQPGRPIIRRRIVFRTTTPLMLGVTTLEPLDNLIKITETVTVKTPVTQDILNSSSPKVGIGNSAGAVKAGMDPATKEQINIASSSEGTLIAVVASMASIIVIMVSVGFYYFFKKYQRQDSSVGSDTSTSWYSYGDPSYMHTELSNSTHVQPAKRGGNLNNSDESVYYESCDNGINRQTGLVTAKSSNNEHSTQTNVTNSQSNCAPAMKTANTNSTTSMQNKSTDSGPAPQAPPRRKRRRPPPLPPQNNDYDNNITITPRQSLGASSQIKQNVYDNDKAVLQFQNMVDNANAVITCQPHPISEHSSSTDHYDNNTDVEPIVQIRGHESTEYASISEMQDMANSEC